jgi:hypothetical protein
MSRIHANDITGIIIDAAIAVYKEQSSSWLSAPLRLGGEI